MCLFLSPCSRTPNQFAALENISLTHLHDVLKWFVTWVSQGWYEFCSLPYSMKIRLNAPDMEALYALPDHYTGKVESIIILEYCSILYPQSLIVNC